MSRDESQSRILQSKKDSLVFSRNSKFEVHLKNKKCRHDGEGKTPRWNDVSDVFAREVHFCNSLKDWKLTSQVVLFPFCTCLSYLSDSLFFFLTSAC